jgi:heme exporter protein CcmD
MNLVQPEQHIYFVTAAYIITALSLGGLIITAWMIARTWTARVESQRLERHKNDS